MTRGQYDQQYDGSSKDEFQKEFKGRVRAKQECMSESRGLSPMSESERSFVVLNRSASASISCFYFLRIHKAKIRRKRDST